MTSALFLPLKSGSIDAAAKPADTFTSLDDDASVLQIYEAILESCSPRRRLSFLRRPMPLDGHWRRGLRRVCISIFSLSFQRAFRAIITLGTDFEALCMHSTLHNDGDAAVARISNPWLNNTHSQSLVPPPWPTQAVSLSSPPALGPESTTPPHSLLP